MVAADRVLLTLLVIALILAIISARARTEMRVACGPHGSASTVIANTGSGNGTVING